MNEYKEPLNASTNEMKRQFNVAYDECIGKGFSYSKEALERITEFKNYNNHVITERCIESVRYVRHKGRFENKPIYACVWKEELTGISCLKEAESL